MSTDHGDHLVSMKGALEEALSGDVDEIVLRERTIGDGASGPAELVDALRTEADRYERLARDGWRLQAPFSEGQVTIHRADDAGESDGPAADGGGVGASGGTAAVDPEAGLGRLLDGVSSLPDAAARLHAAADAYARLATDGAAFEEPVHDGRVHLANPAK